MNCTFSDMLLVNTKLCFFQKQKEVWEDGVDVLLSIPSAKYI